MGFQQALSGLASSSKSLEAIGNNVANSATIGYKAQSAEFSDIFASSLGGGGAGQVGIGVQVAGVQQQFSQGNITTSSNPLDLAINGGGLFRMSNQGTITYSRNGQFQLDKDGYLVNSAGLQLTGLAANQTTGAIIPGSYVPLQVNNSAIPPQVTTLSSVQTNLDSRATPPAAMTAGSATATAAPGTLIITAANNTITGSVDGVTFSGVTIPAATYNSASALATAVQNAINNTAAPAGLSSTITSVTATITAAGKLLLTSNSVGSIGSNGNGSKVATLTGTGAANLGFSPTAGTATGTAAPNLTIAAAPGNVLTGTVDGTAFSASIPPATYGSIALLEAAIQGVITGVTVTDNGTDLVITSNTTGANSSVTITGGTAAGALNLSSATQVAGTAPTLVSGADNFSATGTTSYTSSTAQTVFDSLGNAHTLQLYYAKSSYPGRWQLYTTLDGAQTTGPTVLNFNTTGTMSTLMPLTQTFTVNTGATPTLSFKLDLTGSTQYGISFGTNQISQDGFTSGKLSGMSVSPDGIVQGSYSNGKSRNMGQVVLANFNNLNGLQSVGGNEWSETAVSGQPIPGIPGTGNLGLVQSGAVEESNVDMTAELVDMITQQRAYQANAQTIKTEDQLMQTLINI